MEQCGIVLEERLIEGKMEGQAFTVTAGGLETGRTYTWSAFAKAGGSEITTPVQEFTAPDGNVPIPDPFFKQYLLEQFDLNKDGGISQKEAAKRFNIAAGGVFSPLDFLSFYAGALFSWRHLSLMAGVSAIGFKTVCAELGVGYCF